MLTRRVRNFREFSCLLFLPQHSSKKPSLFIMPRIIIKVKIDMKKAPIAEKFKRCIEKKNLNVFMRKEEWNSGKEYLFTYIRVPIEVLEDLNKTDPPVHGMPDWDGTFAVHFRIHRDFITPIGGHE
jgi:hypothetical protein